ncbi:MAG: acetyl-CoA carboxylase [Pseudomonadota bacterium]
MPQIRSNLPGTFYRKPAPDQPAFVEEGTKVNAGDTIGLVEVMKTFTEVKSDVSGTLVRFLVDNEEPVTAGMPLADVE